MIYDNILTLAKEKKLPISRLEKLAGIGNGVIRKWRGKDPRNAITLRKIASVLDVTIDELINE